MSNPSAVNVDLELSSTDLETEDTPVNKVLVPNAKADSETLSDDVPRETMSVVDVPRETVTGDDADPVADAVATAVEQWIGFDPAVHSVNPDGTPRLRVDGSYARKRGKGGRKSGPDDTSGGDDLFGVGYDRITTGPTIGTGGNTATVPQAPMPTQTAPNMSSSQAALMLVVACTTVLSKVIGPEWHAEKPEQKALADATKIYLDSKGGLNVTPEMGLFIAVSMYAVPRLAQENTRSKLGLAVDWVRDRVTVLRARFSR
jgi:hypothetical protein